jgi:hypothetical protein
MKFLKNSLTFQFFRLISIAYLLALFIIGAALLSIEYRQAQLQIINNIHDLHRTMSPLLAQAEITSDLSLQQNVTLGIHDSIDILGVRTALNSLEEVGIGTTIEGGKGRDNIFAIELPVEITGSNGEIARLGSVFYYTGISVILQRLSRNVFLLIQAVR